MDSGLLKQDSCNASDEEEEEFYSLRTTQRPIKRKNTSTRKVTNEIKPRVETALLGENGLGLTAEEFSALPEDERKQLMEAVLLSKEEYNKQHKKSTSGELETSTNKKTASAMPVKLECSILLPVVIDDTTVAQKCNPVPSLKNFRFKRQVAARDKIHSEAVVYQKNFEQCRVDEDCVGESETNVDNISAEEFKLSAGETDVGVICYKENKDSGLKKIYPEDCVIAQKSNPADLLTCGKSVQLETESSERFSSAGETSHRCLFLANEDNSQMTTADVSATLRKAKSTEANSVDRPDSRTSCQLVRKYHIQTTDMRPLFKRNGLDLQTRFRLIYDYYTACELSYYKSLCEINSRTVWGKPVAIKVTKSKVSTRNQKPREVVAEVELTNNKSPNKDETKTLASSVYSTCNIESEEASKKLTFPAQSDFLEEFSSSTRTSLDVSVMLDDIFKHEDITTRLRRSRQTKIGGGLVEEEVSKISRKKMSTASDDENDPDFMPVMKKKRIHVNTERSEKVENLKKRHLDVVKSKDKPSRKAKEQIPKCSNAFKGKAVGADEYDFEMQESINSSSSSTLQSVVKCQSPATFNGNNSNPPSSSSSGLFCEIQSTSDSMEKHKSVDNTLKDSNPVSQGVVSGCQINVDLEDVLSSNPVCGRNSSMKDDTTLQVFPVFQKLARPSLRENEENTDTTRNIPSTSKNSNVLQSEVNDEYLSGCSSEGDDVENSTKKRKKRTTGQQPAFAKTYQKRKLRNPADQQLIIPFAAPSVKIPKLTQMCPMCQQDIPMSCIEEHVQKCIQLDDEKKRHQMT